jgi:hypothetical protein
VDRVLLKIDNAQGVDIGTAAPVGPTGHMGLRNGVKVRDRIYQPNTAVFGRATTWTSMVGISHLDVCTWAVEPRDGCADFIPKSTNSP